MSQGNLDLIHAAYAAFNRGDFQAAGEVLHPDAVWYPFLGAVEGDVYRGREAILAMWRGLREGFGESLRMEAREVIDLGDAVVVVVEASATGAGSGAQVHQSWAQLATIRDGMIAEVRAYSDREAALAAAHGGAGPAWDR